VFNRSPPYRDKKVVGVFVRFFVHATSAANVFQESLSIKTTAAEKQ
jgi:hypothetical protein